MAIDFLDFTIYLTDQAAVQAAQAAPPSLAQLQASGLNLFAFTQIAAGMLPGDVYASPSQAATLFGAPILTVNDQFNAPCITSPWITDHNQTTFPLDQASFVRGSGAFFGLIGGGDTYIWRGRVQYSPVANSQNPVNGTPTGAEQIQQRRWVDGFEHPEQGEGGSAASLYSRAASRHADGYGFAIRGHDVIKNHPVTQFGALSTVKKSWERLYVRLVQTPSAAVTFWRCHGSVSGLCGMQLAIDATGRIQMLDTDSSGTTTLVGTSSIALQKGVWTRLDFVFGYDTAAQFDLYFNGIKNIGAAGFTGSGLAASGNDHASSEVGQSLGQGSRGLGLDIDDWMGAEQPALFNGNDWLNGSRMVRVDASAFDVDMAGWTGDWRSAPQTPADDGTVPLTSTTSAGLLSLKTNAEEVIDGEPGSIGCVAITISKYGDRGGTVNGTLGYSLAGAADVDATITESTSDIWNSVMYRPAGLITPAPVTPLRLTHVKGASGNTANVYAFIAEAELIGAWGPEDVVTGSGAKIQVIGNTGIHNSPYPRTAWARAGSPPISPVFIVGGTYIGNGVGQDLSFVAPVHFFMVRHVADGTGTWWFSSMAAAHLDLQEAQDPSGMVQALIDPAFEGATGGDADQAQQTLIRIVGNEPHANENGETYQYIAFCDPGMRFMLNGADSFPIGTLDRTTALVNTNFLADALLLWHDSEGGGSGVSGFFKGIGHATQDISELDTSVTNSAIVVSRGSIITKSAIHLTTSVSGAAIPWCLLRRDDGSDDPGIPKVMQLVTYTGDGTHGRSIALTPASGVRPLFALVVSHGGASVFRDPSHLSVHSTKIAATPGDTSAGITGGDIDTLIVDTDCNANGVVYDVWVLPGSATAGNGGFSVNGQFEPVQPATPKDGPFLIAPTVDPTTLAIGGQQGSGSGGAGGVGIGDDFGPGCLGASTALINRALACIGITKPVPTIDTTTPEGTVAGLFYAEDVDTCLRAFPWKFATAYATCPLVAGAAYPGAMANPDWRYSFRLPADAIYLRRVIKPVYGRRFDPDPPKFQIAEDAIGGLVYTNDPNGVIEYTQRPPCAVVAGDALFRQALMWKHAASLAPALSRDDKRMTFCLQMYQAQIQQAQIVAARETQGREDDKTDADWIRDRA